MSDAKQSGLHLLAFFLACLAPTLICSSFSWIHVPDKDHRAVQIQILSDADTSDVVTAIGSLHRNDIDIKTQKSPDEKLSLWQIILFMPISMMFMTGIIISFYKFFCRVLKISPTI